MIDFINAGGPGVWVVATVVGVLIAFLATRNLRARIDRSNQEAAAANAQLIAVYDATIAAKDKLAQSLADSTAKQIEQLTVERKDADERHAAVIADYREKLHQVRNDLQGVTTQKGEFAAELADLRARTDFKPVLDFQQAWYAESQAIHKQMLETMQVIAPVLQEVTETLRAFRSTVQQVHATNPLRDPVPAVGSSKSE